MADVPSGVFTTEQSDLMVKVINAEADAIPVSGPLLTKIATVFTVKPSVPSTPRASDLLGLAGNLNAVIPAGFLLLHNDIVGMKGDKGSSESSTPDAGNTLLSLVKPLFIGAGAAVVAAGLVKGLFGGVSDKTTNHIQDVVDELNQNLTAEDLGSDPAVQKAQKIGFIAYLEAYFLQQAAAMAISGTLEAVGEGAGKAVNSFFTNLFDKEAKSEETPNKLQTIVDSLIGSISVKDYAGDPTIQTALKIGMVAYIEAYFLSQAAAASLDTIGSGVGAAAAGAVTSFIKGIFGKSKKDAEAGKETKSYDKIQSIVDDIIAAQTSSNYVNDTAISIAVKTGIIAYMEAYFISQAAAATTDTVASGVGTAAAGAVTSFIKGIFGKSEKDAGTGKEIKSYDKIQEIVDDIIIAQTSDNYVNDPTIADAVRAGIIAYMEAYFISQAAVATTDTVASGVVSSAMSAVSSFIKGIFGRSEKDASGKKINSYDKIQEIIDDIIVVQTSDRYVNDPEIDKAVKEGVIGYMKAYFTAQAIASTTDSVISSVSTSAGAAVRNFFTGLFGKKEKETDDPSINKISEVVNTVMQNIDVDEILKSPEVQGAKVEGVKSYVISYFETIAKTAADSDLDKIASENKTGLFNKIGNFLFGSSSDENSSAGAFFNKLHQITQSFGDNDIPSAAELGELKRSSLLKAAKAVLNAQVTSINKEISAGDNSAYGLQGATLNVSTIANLQTANENAEQSVELLSKISETLDQLSVLVAAIQSQGPETTVIPIPTSDNKSDLSFSIPG